MGLVAFGVYFTFGMEEEIQTTYYYLESDKITAPIRIALVSDTHSETFGEDNKELYERIQKEEVDLICMPGDILDDKKDPEKGYKSVKDFSTLAPTFYTTGNHEIRRKENKEIQNRMESMRIHVLQGEWKEIEIKGQKLLIGGMDDALLEQEHLEQVETLKEKQGNSFSLLLSHKPHLFDDYRSIPFDVVLCGHAHGGQWSIPHLLENGVTAPGQGFFPKYTKGVHYLEEGKKMVIGRGLASHSSMIPRLYNPPELVILEIH